MGKNPAFQWYPGDWFREPGLQRVDLDVRGAWAELLMMMHHETPRGVSTGSIAGLARQLRIEIPRVCFVVTQLDMNRIADVEYYDEESKVFVHECADYFSGMSPKCPEVSPECPYFVTIKNRRMVNEEKVKEYERLKKQKQRTSPVITTHVPKMSPSPSPSPSPSTPSPTPKTTKKRTLLANPTGFAAFWSCYPKKLGKGQAEKAWNRVNPQNGLVEVIIASVEAHIITPQWADPQFIPYPATFLNDRRWEDVLLIHTTSPHSTAKTQGNLAALHSFLEQTHDRSRPASVLNADVPTRGDLPGEAV